jgi:hypothetical protein
MRTKHTIYIETTKNYEFQAMVDIQDISPAILVNLKLDPDQEQVNIDGEFQVEWDDDIPLVRVLSVFIGNIQIFDDNKDDNEFETYNLELAIEQHGPADEWYQDAAANKAEADFEDYYH